MSFKLQKDIRVWDYIKKNVIIADDYSISVGWWPEQRYGAENDNLQMAQVAQWNNEGHVNGANSLIPGAITPPRPFMSVGLPTAFAAGANKNDFKDMIQAVLTGKSVMVAMQKSTTNFEETLRKVMLDWDTPRNSPLTVKMKGFDNPLINSGELIANVTAKVVSKSESKS